MKCCNDKFTQCCLQYNVLVNDFGLGKVKKEREEKNGPVRDLNPGPLAPKARIIPLDQQAVLEIQDHSELQQLQCKIKGLSTSVCNRSHKFKIWAKGDNGQRTASPHTESNIIFLALMIELTR